MLEVFRLLKAVETSNVVILVLDELPKRNVAVALLLRTYKVVLNRLAPRVALLVFLLSLRFGLRE